MLSTPFKIWASFAAAVIFGCSSKSATSRLDARFGAEYSQVQSHDDDRDTKGDDASEKSQEKASIPANVAGGYLMGFDNARVACDFFNDGASSHKVVCRAAAIQFDGSTRPVVGLKPGVLVNWQDSLILAGAASSVACSVDSNNLKQTCDVQSASNSLALNFGFGVVESGSQRTRTETSVVHLPYSVGVAAGLILKSTQLYAPSALDAHATASAANSSGSTLLGFQSMPPILASRVGLTEPGSMCWSNGSTFFAVQGAIWELRGDKIQLFAGAATAKADDLSHRFRIRLGESLSIACNEKIVVVGDSPRILSVDRSSGSVRLIAGKGTNGFWNSEQNLALGDAGQLFATSVAIHGAGGIAIAPDESILAVDNGAQRIFKIDTTGRMQSVAGTGVSGFSGDGGPAKAAQVYNPRGLAVGLDNTVFIADGYNHRIRKITPAGIMVTIAGTGEQNSAGDGGPALAAKLSLPSALALGVDQSLYLTETAGSQRVRKIGPDGVISTVAGTVTGGFSGDNGPGNQAKLLLPSGLALIDGKKLIISDSGNNRLRQLDFAGNIVTVAGNGQRSVSGDNGMAISAQFESLAAIAVASDHSMYLADQSAANIRRVGVDGKVTAVSRSESGGTYADGAQIASTRLSNPVAMVFASDQTLYVVQGNLHKVRKVATNGVVSTAVGLGMPGFAGDGGAAVNAKLNSPADIVIGTDQSLYIADSSNHRIRRVDANGVISTVAGNGSVDELSSPQSVAVGNDQSLYIADTGNGRIRQLSPGGTLTTLQIEVDGTDCIADPRSWPACKLPRELDWVQQEKST